MLRAPDSVQITHDALGKLEIWLAGPGVLVQRVHGQGGLQIARAIAAFNDQLIKSGTQPLIFNDWEEMNGYTTEARTELTAWTVANLRSIRGVHVLLKSKLVAMGLAIANVALGGIANSYTQRSDFERALTEAVQAAANPIAPAQP